MSLKIIIITGAIAGILILALFGFDLKGAAIKGMAQDLDEYNCGEDSFCTSCIIEGETCGCGQHTCDCGNKTVNKTECMLF